MKLNDLAPGPGANRPRKRIGRGPGSGQGKTSGKGHKGQNARTGGGVRPGYEGGQMPIHRRLPKRGFTNPTRKEVAVINIRDLNRFDRESIVDDVALMQSGLIKGPLDGIKLLGQGEIKHPLTVKVNAVSKAAREKIEGAGGTVEVC